MLGGGARRRLVACPVSEPGFVVGNVRDDGWLTLRRAPGRASPVVERQLEGQRVTVFGRQRAVPGVIAVRSIHLTRGRDTGGDVGFTVDSAYLDIGAATRAEVAAADVGVLSPVAAAKRPQRYGTDLLAAPVAARRTACAALVLAARHAIAEQGMVPRDQSMVIAFVVEQDLSGRGLATVGNVQGRLPKPCWSTARRAPPARSPGSRTPAGARPRALGSGDPLDARCALPGDGGRDDFARRG